jgi:4'-phosphopantetheinyl transferase
VVDVLSPTTMAMNVFWLQQTEADVPTDDHWLCANEELRLSGLHFAKRRADWRLGRWTAKCAVATYLGRSDRTHPLSDIEIRSAPSGAPEVFLAGQAAGIALSLSHREGAALAAIVASGIALGCDLELVEPRSDAFIADYFTAAEQVLVAGAPALDRPALLALLWSAKESALKAVGQGLRLDTRSVLVRVDCYGISGNAGRPSDDQWAQSSQYTSDSHEGWHPLQVCYLSDGHSIRGWWQRRSNFILTLVADAPLLPPVSLKIPRL